MIDTPDSVESTLRWDLARGFPRQGLGWRRRTATRKIFVTMRAGKACMVKKPARPMFNFLNTINAPQNLWHGDHTNLLHDTTVWQRGRRCYQVAPAINSVAARAHITSVTSETLISNITSFSTFYRPLELDNSYMIHPSISSCSFIAFKKPANVYSWTKQPCELFRF